MPNVPINLVKFHPMYSLSFMPGLLVIVDSVEVTSFVPGKFFRLLVVVHNVRIRGRRLPSSPSLSSTRLSSSSY